MPTVSESIVKVPLGESAPLSRPTLLREVERRTGTLVSSCLQCHKCSSGCLVGDDADVRVSQVLRLLHLGLDTEALGSQAIWLCSSCQTCTTRCPMGIDVARVMDSLRILAVEHQSPSTRSRGRKFASAFLASVRRHGRVFELGMLTAYKLSTFTLFRDLDQGLRLALAGRLRFWPSRSRSAREVRRLFARARSEEQSK